MDAGILMPRKTRLYKLQYKITAIPQRLVVQSQFKSYHSYPHCTCVKVWFGLWTIISIRFLDFLGPVGFYSFYGNR